MNQVDIPSDTTTDRNIDTSGTYRIYYLPMSLSIINNIISHWSSLYADESYSVFWREFEESQNCLMMIGVILPVIGFTIIPLLTKETIEDGLTLTEEIFIS